jgi:hypothetical protein
VKINVADALIVSIETALSNVRRNKIYAIDHRCTMVYNACVVGLGYAVAPVGEDAMSTAAMIEVEMAKSEAGPGMVRLSGEAIQAVRIAAGSAGVSITAYASRVLLEAAERDIEAGYKARQKPKRKGGAE